MKFKALSLAIFAMVPAIAMAGVTITPMVGYQTTKFSKEEHRDVLNTGYQTNFKAGAPVNNNGGVTMNDRIQESIAVGVELTNNVLFELEYGQVQATGWANKKSIPKFKADVREQTYSGNFSIDVPFFGLEGNHFKPYVLLGAGQSVIEVKKQQMPNYDRRVLAESTDTIGNLALGAKYHFNDMIAVRAEGRAIYNFDHRWVDLLGLVGVQLRLGATQAPAPLVEEVYVPPAPIPVAPVVIVAPEPIDSDKDGVFDPQDQCPNTPLNYVVDSVGCPKEITTPVSIPLEVLFDTNKSIVKPQYKDKIAKVAEFMKVYPSSSTMLEGHTDSRGSAKLNTKLSNNRAVAIKNVLVNEMGISSSRLEAKGFGPSRPVATNATPEGRALNRRTVAIVSATKTSVITK